MALNDLSHQRQPEADAFARFARTARAVERFEYALAFIFRYTRAAVFDGNQHTAALIAQHACLHLTAIGMTARIFQQIAQ